MISHIFNVSSYRVRVRGTAQYRPYPKL